MNVSRYGDIRAAVALRINAQIMGSAPYSGLQMSVWQPEDRKRFPKLGPALSRRERGNKPRYHVGRD
jgi:hypothetical protein